jgi:zinc-finger of transposase IS204/IS1001/IS1096/IS1165
VVRVVEDEIDKLVIEVADRRRVVRCPACGQMTSKVHEARKVEIRDLPLGRPAPLVWLQWRFDSPTMGIDTPRTIPRPRARSPCFGLDRWCGTRVPHHPGAAAPAPLVVALDHAAGAGLGGGRRGPSTRESRCRVLLITSSFYGISEEGAP